MHISITTIMIKAQIVAVAQSTHNTTWMGVRNSTITNAKSSNDHRNYTERHGCSRFAIPDHYLLIDGAIEQERLSYGHI